MVLQRYLLVFSIFILLVGCKEKHTSTNENQTELAKSSRYSNPVIRGDFADPSVIRVENTYYSVGTSSEWAPHFPIFTSKNLVNWKQESYALQVTPEWAASSFWAPELYYHNETFYLYYVAKRKSDDVSYIGVAISENPKEGFTDKGVLLEYGSEAIDPFILNDDGQLYMSFKAYGLDDRPIELLAAKLSNDGLKVEGEPFSLLKDENARGIEGQYIVKKDDFYYLFYSEGACCGSNCDYDIRVARASDFKGPYEKNPENPILEGDGEWKCPGHGTMVETADDNWFYMYHAYNGEDDIYTGRQALLDEIKWNENSGWPEFVEGKNPSAEFAISSENIQQKDFKTIKDNFEGDSLSYFWQWDFRNAEPQINLENGKLSLSGKIKDQNKSGTVLTVRPYTGSYEIVIEVLNENQSLKGLSLYGDASQAVGIGIRENKIQLWEVKDNNRKILNEKTIETSNSVQLKMKVEKGYKCMFLYKTESTKNWEELKSGNNKYYDGQFLPQWDRSPRPGLIHFGAENKPAEFTFFEINYK